MRKFLGKLGGGQFRGHSSSPPRSFCFFLPRSATHRHHSLTATGLATHSFISLVFRTPAHKL